LFSIFPVVCIVGARQVGKTTLARQYAEQCKEDVTYFDLEKPDDLERLRDPMLALEKLNGLVVLDEIQRIPEIFQILRVLVDRPNNPARFLILGSASPDLLRQTSESLAGRITYFKLRGFSLDEVGFENHERLWLRGGFPRSYLAQTDSNSNKWRQQFISTYLEKDLPQLGINISSTTLRRFWMMLAHYHGQIWNASELARSFGVAHTTIRRYLDVLTSALVVVQLHPWHENISKRQVKSPKVYITDSGLMHTLLGCITMHDLEGNPKVGASWEGFVLTELVQRLNVREEECYFWATQRGAELDLLIVRGQKRVGFEIKRTTVPKITRSVRSALGDLHLDRLDIIHAGGDTYPLSDKVRAVALTRIQEDLKPLS
jgi:predicted AAA+ superfamily ATPase